MDFSCLSIAIWDIRSFTRSKGADCYLIDENVAQNGEEVISGHPMEKMPEEMSFVSMILISYFTGWLGITPSKFFTVFASLH